ncbi:MAG: YbgA family protein, partial [Candidatus Bipolaricaulota bacterium]
GKPIENEGRLRSHRIREKFYTSLFAVARYRNGVENEPRMEDLIEFHARHKYILLANDEGRLRKMGRLVANDEGRDVDVIVELYGEDLSAALRNEVNPNAHVNVLQHAYGYFSDDLNDDEKSLFFEYVENFRAGKVPLSTLISMVRSWIRRFNQEYLADQYYFNPYPSDLAAISDSGKGVDL